MLVKQPIRRKPELQEYGFKSFVEKDSELRIITFTQEPLPRCGPPYMAVLPRMAAFLTAFFSPDTFFSILPRNIRPFHLRNSKDFAGT